MACLMDLCNGACDASGESLPEDLDQLPVVRVPIISLLDADSPRLSGENAGHIQSMVESDDPLPPILVHRPTMRVIDGMHRLIATKLCGKKEIEARFFDGDEASAFVLAVRSNAVHGLPLSLEDRKAATARIISSHPHWSDRMIASATRLSPKTVAAIRERPTKEEHRLDGRLGSDGRTRPLNAAKGRGIAGKVLEKNPNASLREIARIAGISPETARDVRARFARGESLVPLGPAGTRMADIRKNRRQKDKNRDQRKVKAISAPPSALRSLMMDPAFRSTENGRALLRMLSAHEALMEHGEQLAGKVPAHCAERLVDAARACARAWQDFADLVESHSSQMVAT